ncbi:hypothetical protein [Melaminivora alkalimesophila]|uniref:Uncharacterized protein n=1 Tax=Melaminivora alkalimesophila TaxID=1165852 RepID=A0A317R9A5_9BURK|nr:hypothetical protein [Melaminivora alkalimesophila]PWW43685.1 hypothetical protein DFR36_10936 [Melaminivora alkalimesophila]
MPEPLSPLPAVDQALDRAARDRPRDRGRFTQYGLRSDPRPEPGDRTNPGTGDHPRRFGASGDPGSYANRPADAQGPQVHDQASDAPAHPGTP